MSIKTLIINWKENLIQQSSDMFTSASAWFFNKPLLCLCLISTIWPQVWRAGWIRWGNGGIVVAWLQAAAAHYRFALPHTHTSPKKPLDSHKQAKHYGPVATAVDSFIAQVLIFIWLFAHATILHNPDGFITNQIHISFNHTYTLSVYNAEVTEFLLLDVHLLGDNLQNCGFVCSHYSDMRPVCSLVNTNEKIWEWLVLRDEVRTNGFKRKVSCLTHLDVNIRK